MPSPTCPPSEVADALSPAGDHEAVLDRCLKLLNEHLHQDICDIRDSGLGNTDIPDLSARIARALPDAVRQACLLWPVHLMATSCVSETVSVALLEFCTHHLLHWLEVLSLLGELSSARERLPDIMAWSQVSILPTS
jgi:hypothetical protein